jgi:hypothetical protein
MEVAGLIQAVHLERRLPRDRVQAPLVRWFHPQVWALAPVLLEDSAEHFREGRAQAGAKEHVRELHFQTQSRRDG